jgi:uncharacterized protein YkwD
MARIFCPKCGAGTDDPSQVFCTSCGTRLSATPVTPVTPAAPRAGIPAWALAGAAVLAILAAAVVLWPGMMNVVSGTFLTGLSGSGQAEPVTLSPAATLIPATTPPSVTTVPETPVTTIATTVPTPATTRAVTRTRATVSVGQTFTVATEAETVEAAGTSQITLAQTYVPEQPTSGSYYSATPGAPYIDHSALEARIHELINVQREQNGYASLSYDSFLADIARGHSWDMVVRVFFEHENPDGQNARARGEEAGYPCVKDYGTYYTSGLSENLYQGYRYNSYWTAPNGTITSYNWNTMEDIAQQAVNGWMNSEGHKKNILDSHFDREGIGVAFSSDDKVLVTENFC